jgi:hypothetical protein
MLESLSASYQYNWKETKGTDGKINLIKAVAKTSNGDDLHINFIYKEGRQDWEVEFRINSGLNKTNSGDAFKVLGTVRKAFMQFYAQVNPSRFYFSAEKDNDDDSSSRMKLYDRFAKGIAKETGMSMTSDNLSGGYGKVYEFKKIKKRKQ